ncbi:MAG: hypothetical protein HUK40_16860 [Desulfobacter sp.]|nr:hypothetical protein [Desulfobacter sp.]WDP86977.1 MAG: hypothetical protein HUN05_19120 [Desulfobacter sp.]
MWKGINPEQIKELTIPETQIAPGQHFSRQISPVEKLAIAHRSDYAAGKDKSGIYSGILPPGENGIRLALRVKGKLISKQLVVVITEEKQ